MTFICVCVSWPAAIFWVCYVNFHAFDVSLKHSCSQRKCMARFLWEVWGHYATKPPYCYSIPGNTFICITPSAFLNGCNCMSLSPLLHFKWISTLGWQVCSLYPQCFTEQNFFHVGKLAFYSSFHPHIRVLLLLFLAAFTPTLLVLASYDSGLLIVFMAWRNPQGYQKITLSDNSRSYFF